MRFSPRPNRAAEIRWREWGDEAFREAAAQNKPILLGISAVWCHWCHVMDETSYSDGEVIDIINERFVPIRVDNDRRPDVNARYNMGGWPTTVFLTPDGEILHGATYVPLDPFKAMLRQIADFWQDPERRLEVNGKIAAAKAERGDARPQADGAGGLDPHTAKAVVTALERSFDEQYGGFGDEPKFPQSSALNFLLDDFARSKSERARWMVQKTLHAMAGGGMYDHVEGGFFRYSTTRDFSVPHFEKMLEDLAGLLLACARAGALFGDEELGKTAAGVVRYAGASLWNPAYGAYGGSQDADEEYYAKDAAARALAEKPYVDPTMYASWNAEMARALIISGPLVEGGGGWVERGIAVLESLWSKLTADGLVARYYDGRPHVRGLLADQAWSALAATSAWSASGDPKWLERAARLIDAAEELFDREAGAYRDRLPDAADSSRLAIPSMPIDENAVMARALLARAAFSGEVEHEARARRVLARYAGGYRALGTFGAGYASAVLDALDPPIDVHVVGDRTSPATSALRAAALALPMPPTRLDSLDPRRDPGRLAASRYEPAESGVAYLCRGPTCFARAKTAQELVESLVAAARTA